MLRGCDEVLIIFLLPISNFIKLIVEILKLGCFSHLILQHKLRCLQRTVATLAEKVQAIVDKSLIEVHSPLSEEIATMANNFDTTLRVVSIEAEKNFMMREDIPFLDSDALWCPSALDCVVVLL